MRVMIWVQHLLGMGHLMRAAALARAVAGRGVETLLVSGGPVSNLVDAGKARVVTLPPTRAADVSFKILLDDKDDVVTDEWWEARIGALMKTTADFDPDVIVTETFPFGRKKFRNELLPLIAERRQREKPVLFASSVRDILVESDPKKEDWMVEIAVRDFDLVLVHGDPDLIRLDASFHHTADIADKIAYTGYIVSAPDRDMTGDGDDEVIVSCGSGAVGRSLLDAAEHARALSKRAGDARWRILAGYGISADAFDALSERAPDGVIVERARPDFIAMLKRARLSINQGGYNTVMDVVSTGVPSVVVPISAKGETEQEQRADLLAQQDLLVCLPERDLSPETLAAAADRALVLDPPAHGIDIGGAARSADVLIDAWQKTVRR